MVSATDLITYIGVPLTVAGVIPLLWNMYKALWIRRKLSKAIAPQARQYCTLIADPAAGTVTVVASTPKLAQPGLWATFEKTVVFTTPTLPSRDDMDDLLSKLTQAQESFTPRTFKQRLLRQWERLISPLKDTVILWKAVVRSPTWLSSSSRTLLGDVDKISKLSTLVRGTSFDLTKSQSTALSWMSIIAEGDCTLQIRERASSGFVGFEQGLQRYIVDVDLRVEPLFLGMTWTQFIWFALAFGVNHHNADFCALLSMLCQNFEMNMPADVVLHDCEGRPLLKVVAMEKKFVASLFRRTYEYDLRTALLAENILMRFTMEEEPTGAHPGSRTSFSVFCRSLNSTEFINMSAVDKIDRLGLLHGLGEKPSLILGGTLKECPDPLSAMMRWARDDVFQHVSQELREMRVRSLWYLHHTKATSLPTLLKEKFPEGDLARDIENCLSETAQSSEYVGHTKLLLEKWSACLVKISEILRPLERQGFMLQTRGQEIMNSAKRTWMTFRDEMAEANLRSRAKVEETANMKQRSMLWSTLQSHATFIDLKDGIDTDKFSHLPPGSPEIEDAKTLLRVFLSLTTWDRWARIEWPLCSDLAEVDQLLDEIEQSFKSGGRHQKLQGLLAKVPQIKPFENGAFRAPPSPLRRVFGEDPELKIPDDLEIHLL